MSRVIAIRQGQASTVVKAGATTRRALVKAGLRGAPGSGGGSAGVTSFNTRIGAVTLLGSDVTTALGYTPLNGATLASVAFSGSYADLSDKPFIPTTAGDVGAEAVGTAVAVVGIHKVDPDAHPDYLSAINTAMQAALTTGLVFGNNGDFLVALDDTTLRITAVSGLYFENELGDPGAAVKSFAQQDIPLSSAGLASDGIFIRYIAINAAGVVSFSATPVDHDVDRVQLGLTFLQRVAGVTSFINGTTGPLNVMTIPTLANVSYTDRAFQSLAASVPLSPNADLTMSQGEGRVLGEAINWGDPDNVNAKTIAAATPMVFLPFAGGGGLASVPAPTSTFDPTQYWNGTALTGVPTANNSTVQRIMVTLRGTIVVQYGEHVYANIDDAFAAMLVAPFSPLFPTGYAVEIARVALRRNGTSLTNTNDARIAIFGSGGTAGGSSSGGGAVDSVNGQTGTVVLDTDDINEGSTNRYYPDADRTKVAGIETGAQVNVGTNLGQGTRTGTTLPLTSSTGSGTTLPVASTSLAGLQSAADKLKLDGVSPGASANSSDAFLLNRANHSGTQTISTVDGLQTELDAKQAILESGTNLKTVNGNSLLGSGDLVIAGGGTVVSAIGATFDGGGDAVTTDAYCDVYVPFGMTITGATIVADSVGDIVIDVRKVAFASFPPTGSDSITGATPPTLSSSDKVSDTSLTGWTTTITAGDVVRFIVSGTSTIAKCSIQLHGVRS